MTCSANHLNSSSVRAEGHAPAGVAPAPLPTSVGANNSDPAHPPASQTAADASASPLSFSIDPGMAGFGLDFEAEVAALEAQWARDGICMNATTFLVSVISDSISKSTSVSARA